MSVIFIYCDHILFVDVNMPGLDGLSALNQLVELYKERAYRSGDPVPGAPHLSRDADEH